MSIDEYQLLKSKKGNLEIIPLQAEDATSGRPVALKSKNGALQVDLVEMEQVQISLPDGANLNVEVQNTDPIPVMFAATPDVAVPDGVDVANFPSSFQVSNFPPAVTDDVIAVAPVVGEKTITSIPAALFAGASPLASRWFMRVRNLSLEQQILVGPSTVANTGFPIEPGGEVLLKFNKEVPVALYGISSGAAAKVRVMEA